MLTELILTIKARALYGIEHGIFLYVSGNSGNSDSTDEELEKRDSMEPASSCSVFSVKATAVYLEKRYIAEPWLLVQLITYC